LLQRSLEEDADFFIPAGIKVGSVKIDLFDDTIKYHLCHNYVNEGLQFHKINVFASNVEDYSDSFVPVDENGFCTIEPAQYGVDESLCQEQDYKKECTIPGTGVDLRAGTFLVLHAEILVPQFVR